MNFFFVLNINWPTRLTVRLIVNASIAFVTSQRQGSLAELKCVLQSSHITAESLSQYARKRTQQISKGDSKKTLMSHSGADPENFGGEGMKL